MRIGNYQFKPKWFTTLLTVLLLPVLCGLGFWQLHRAEEKRLILLSQRSRMEAPVFKLESLVEKPADLEFRRIQARGKFDTRYQILIDNKIVQGHAGYQVVTPLQLQNTDVYVLVNRGWIAMNADRRILPETKTPAGLVTVSGVIKLDPRDVADFGSGNRSNQGWPAMVRWLDIKALQAETGLKLQPFVILQSAEKDSVYVRDWKVINMPPEKSLGYAAQWFSFATIILGLFIVLNTSRVNKSGNQE